MGHIVGEKGQVVINKEIRERLGVERGWSTIQRLVNDHVEVYFVPPTHRESLHGALKAKIRRRPSPDEDWDAMRERAWAEASQDEEDLDP